METYYYTISYDDRADDFYGVVDGKIEGNEVIVYEITDTEEMVDYIKTGVMKHIDDVKGLEKFLKAQEKLQSDDQIVMLSRTNRY